jgi:sugar/nucleoside kinase (ribokinase family)
MQVEKHWDAVVAGHICLDLIPDLSQLGQTALSALLRPGQLVQVGDVAIATGGPVSNTGLALHILGIKTQLMGKLGDDPLGQVVRQIVAGYGTHLADGMVVDPAASTSYSVIVSPPGVDRIFLHSPGANMTFSADDVRYAVVSAARLFHFGYPPLMRRMYIDEGAELEALYRQVRELGVTTSLDMAVPDPLSEGGRANWGAILRRVMPYVDVFLPSIEEILFMLRRPTYESLSSQVAGGSLLPLVTPDLLSDVSAELLEMGGRVVGLKLGDRGFYLRTAGAEAMADMGAAAPPRLPRHDPGAWAERELWIPCFQAQLVGTTGAGDATIAGFLSGLLRGMGVKETVRMAVAVGACNVEAADALGGLRSWNETVARVAGGWARHALEVTADGWVHDADYGLWEKAR